MCGENETEVLVVSSKNATQFTIKYECAFTNRVQG